MFLKFHYCISRSQSPSLSRHEIQNAAICVEYFEGRLSYADYNWSLTSFDTSKTPSWTFLYMVAAVLMKACKKHSLLKQLIFCNNCSKDQQNKLQHTDCQKLITSSTFWAVFAEASMKINPCSFANCSPSSVLTALLWARSHLFPISMIVMFAFACCRASSNQLAKWLKVSLLTKQLKNDNLSLLSNNK